MVTALISSEEYGQLVLSARADGLRCQMLTPSDAADLDFYFGVGLGSIKRSIMGDMLSHAESFYIAPSVRRKSTEITARPTAEVRPHGGYDPDELDILRYGRVSRRLGTCPTIVQRTLECWHGDLGARFARLSCGRYAALVHLTPTGQTLIRHARTTASGRYLDMSDTERLINDLHSDDPRTKKIVGQALLEARELHRLACDAY